MPLAGAAPRALIVTVYGLYARDAGGWLSVAALIRLMAVLGAEEAAVRSAISRLKQRGLLQPARRDGAAGYALSALGEAVLAEGDQRIFRRPRSSAEDGWLLAVFSVPEHQRSKRHTLRSRLTWLGFGTVAAGVWIAPGQLAGPTRDMLASHGLSEYVSLFRADYLAFGDVAGQVGRWWDLSRLEQLYAAFTDAASPVLARWEARDGSGAAEREPAGAAAFRDYVRVLTAWRRLPFLDPGLPAGLLPEGWRGTRAAEVFDALAARLAGPARGYAREVTGAGQGTTA